MSQFATAPPSAAYGTCATVRPSAGGNSPLWQVEHWPVTGNCVWFQEVAGRHELVPWQLPQVVTMLPVGMCVLDLPLAPLPWQPAVVQLVVVGARANGAWSGLPVVAQLTVDLWHDSQVAVPMATWVAERPTAGANAPVWQFAQPPITATLLCTFAGFHAVSALL